MAGAIGATGATGPAGTTDSYAYIYNLAAQTVAIAASVTFDTNGLIGTGISHAPGSTDVVFADAGIYKLAFSTSGTEPNQMALFLNGVAIPGSTYGSGAGTQQNSGQTIVAIGAGDVLTLRNHASAAAVGLSTVIGGTEANVNASLLIERLN